jgi:hypothetical protein
MISINDVECKALVDTNKGSYVLTRLIKAKWNSMTQEERSHYWTANEYIIHLNASALLCELYDKIEDNYYDDELYERLWADTPARFVQMLQLILDEISDFPSANVLKRDEQIDPRIDLEEVKS